MTLTEQKAPFIMETRTVWPEEPDERLRTEAGTLDLPAELRRIDGNFTRMEAAFAKLSRRRPRRPWRTAAAARINPDRIQFAWVIVALNAAFLAAAMLASFAGQYAAAPSTFLAPWLYWVVPLSIDLPIVSASFMAAIYRKRKQRGAAAGNWIVVGFLTAANSAIQSTHVLTLNGGFAGKQLTVADWVGVGIMSAIPLLVFYFSDNLGRLLVKPTGEARETPVKAPARRTTTRKRK